MRRTAAPAVWADTGLVRTCDCWSTRPDCPDLPPPGGGRDGRISPRPAATSGTMAGVPKKPQTSNDELARMFWRVEANAAEVLMQQMLGRLGQQTSVGGKRV